MKYVDWVEAVLTAAARELHENASVRMVGVPIATIAQKVGLVINPMSPEFHGSDERMAIF